MPNAIESDTKAWQVGVPDDGKGGIPFVWEFLNVPKVNSEYILRIYYRGIESNTKEQFIDFSVPYLPKITPNGEVVI